MAKFQVTVTVEAPDPMMAKLYEQGLQNVCDELVDHQSILIELSNRDTARAYKNRLMGLINNPMIKKLAGMVG